MKTDYVKKGLVVGIIVLFIGSNFVYGLNIQLKNTTNPLINSRGYIQDLIDNASDGDTIYIPSGIYYENIIINKSISLVGEDKNITILDGSIYGSVVSIVVDWVNISGFTIQSSGDEWTDAGINIHSNHNTITDNTILNNNYDGIFLYYFSDNNIITGNNVSNNEDGLYLIDSDDNIITGNNILNNGDGIYISGSDSNTITNNNISSNNWGGMHLCYSSSNNIITDNNITNNDKYGIEFFASSSNNIIGNTMVDNGISIDGYMLEHWNTHVIDTLNTVNGKPVIYWKNKIDGIIPTGAGEVILANCTNVLVENQNISGSDDGIELGFSSECIITGNNISNNDWDGISLWLSSGNIITGNNISKNDCGINLRYFGSNNIITGNNITNNYDGIYLYYSSSNNIRDNKITNNYYGIRFWESSSNNIKGNNISNNVYECIHLREYSDNNTIIGNNILNNYYGLYLENSSSNNIEDNTISKNWIGIYLFFSSGNTLQRNNFLYNLLNAFFIFNTYGKNEWQQNYWSRPRILPKIIFGIIEINSKKIPWLNIDWHPAQKPYDIS